MIKPLILTISKHKSYTGKVMGPVPSITVLKRGSAATTWRIQKVELKLCSCRDHGVDSRRLLSWRSVSLTHPIHLVTNDDGRWLITTSDNGLFSNARLCEYTLRIAGAPEAFNHAEQWDTKLDCGCGVGGGTVGQTFSLSSQMKRSDYCTNLRGFGNGETVRWNRA